MAADQLASHTGRVRSLCLWSMALPAVLVAADVATGLPSLEEAMAARNDAWTLPEPLTSPP